MPDDVKAHARDLAVFLGVASLVLTGGVFSIGASDVFVGTGFSQLAYFIGGSNGGHAGNPVGGRSSNPGAGGDPTNNDNGTRKGSSPSSPSSPSNNSSSNTSNSSPSRSSNESNSGNNNSNSNSSNESNGGNLRGPTGPNGEAKTPQQSVQQQAARTRQYASDLANYGQARAQTQAPTPSHIGTTVSSAVSNLTNAIKNSFRTQTPAPSKPSTYSGALNYISRPSTPPTFNRTSIPYTPPKNETSIPYSPPTPEKPVNTTLNTTQSTPQKPTDEVKPSNLPSTSGPEKDAPTNGTGGSATGGPGPGKPSQAPRGGYKVYGGIDGG